MAYYLVLKRVMNGNVNVNSKDFLSMNFNEKILNVNIFYSRN